MKIIETKLVDCLIIEPKVFSDERGFFMETFQASRYLSEAKITFPFVQDNHSRSTKGVLRGLHFQRNKPQGKLVRVSQGSVYDVVVDLRPNSKTYGCWEGFTLSEENKRQLWIPPGFAHGFLVTSEIVDFEYKCTAYYDSKDEETLLWNDPYLNILWPIKNPILSSKDLKGKNFINLQL